MVQINFAQKQVSAKIVYYGPGMSGKTTNLEVIHQRAPDQNKGELTSISTDGDRTLFFDFMPLDLGTVAGMKTSFQIYTVPGQVYYNSTRKLVLQGVDGVVFVADSSASMLNENLESLRNLEENLNEYGKSLATIAHVIQYNKRDLPDAMSVEELAAHLNLHGAPHYEAIANTGQGVFPTLKALAARVLEMIHAQSGSRGAAPTPTPAPAARPQVGAPQPQAPLPQMTRPVQAQPVAPAVAAAAAAQTPSRIQLNPPRQPAGQPALGQTGFRTPPAPPMQPPSPMQAPVQQQPQPMQPPMAPPPMMQAPVLHAPAPMQAPAPQAPMSATGLHPNYNPNVQQLHATGVTPQAYAQAPVAPVAPQPLAQPQYAPQQPDYGQPQAEYGQQPQSYAQPAYAPPPQQPQSFAAPAQPANLHLAGRASAPSAPKNVRTGAVPQPLEGTRFRPRGGAGQAPGARSEARPTPARTASSKLFVGVFVAAGVILAAGVAYLAVSFL
jgi:signal recognition particle receptor subunit beta